MSGRFWPRIIDALGTNAAARLLAGSSTRMMFSLESCVHGREAAAVWLVGSEPLLGGARPIDVPVTEGAAPVVRAIDGIAEGAYA